MPMMHITLMSLEGIAMARAKRITELMQRVAELEEALAPFARLKVTPADKREGNAGIYSLFLADIERARAALQAPAHGETK